MGAPGECTAGAIGCCAQAAADRTIEALSTPESLCRNERRPRHVIFSRPPIGRISQPRISVIPESRSFYRQVTDKPNVQCGREFLSQQPYYVSIGSVYQPDEAVLGPTFIVCLGANRIQLSPSCAYLDAALGNAVTHQLLFDPVSASLRKVKIVEPVASR